MKRILFFGVILLSQAICAQTMRTLTPDEIQTDFGILKQALEEAHPGLYRYTSKPEMDSNFDMLQNSLKVPLSEQEFYKRLLPLISEIGCGHIKLLPPKNEPYNYYYNAQALFPLRLFFTGDTAYALSSYGKPMSFEAGARILAINGEQMGTIVGKLKKALFSDGRNTTFKYYEINKYFNGLYGNIFTKEGNPPTSFTVNYLEDGKEKTVVLDPVPLEEIKAAQETENPEPSF